MADVACTRCTQSKPALEKPPFKGAVGTKIAENVCQSCWDEWSRGEVMLINEYQLNLGNAEHRQFLYEQMGQYFSLPADQE